MSDYKLANLEINLYSQWPCQNNKLVILSCACPIFMCYNMIYHYPNAAGMEWVNIRFNMSRPNGTAFIWYHLTSAPLCQDLLLNVWTGVTLHCSQSVLYYWNLCVATMHKYLDISVTNTAHDLSDTVIYFVWTLWALPVSYRNLRIVFKTFKITCLSCTICSYNS